MCIFSQPVKSVDKTRIFARHAGGDRQYLAYSMSYSSVSEMAMILPLPTPPSSPEDAVRFIDLSGYPEFFDDLDQGYPPPPIEYLLGIADGTLEVHDVGSFEASFVPTRADFARLDARFRLDDEVWSHLPDYADYGFAVFKLKPGTPSVHPIAFEFPNRAPADLYFPTVHVHDGIVHRTAQFDHILYCQPVAPFQELELSLWRYPDYLYDFFMFAAWSNAERQHARFNCRFAPRPPWEVSWKHPGQMSTTDAYRAERINSANYIRAGDFISIDRAQGIVEPRRFLLRKHIFGPCLNTDVVLRA